MPKQITEERYLEACENNEGYCYLCRSFTGDFGEPDARKYKCPECEKLTVYGAEEALMQGLITF